MLNEPRLMLKKTMIAVGLGAMLSSPTTLVAQKYTILAVCHTENKVAEIDPGTTEDRQAALPDARQQSRRHRHQNRQGAASHTGAGRAERCRLLAERRGVGERRPRWIRDSDRFKDRYREPRDSAARQRPWTCRRVAGRASGGGDARARGIGHRRGDEADPRRPEDQSQRYRSWLSVGGRVPIGGAAFGIRLLR
jgi:hypothetical protein